MSSGISKWLVASVVALAPLPSGSVDLPWVATWCAALGLALAVSPLHEIGARHLKLLAPVFALLVAFALTIWIQAAPDPRIAPAHPIWTRAEELLGTTLPHRVAAGASHPLVAVGLPLLMFLAFLSGFFASVERRRAVFILEGAAVAGAAYALLALGSAVYGTFEAFWSSRSAPLDPLSDPFVNRNHAATYYGSCAVLSLVLVLTRIQRVMARGELESSRIWAGILEDQPIKLAVLTSAFALTITATFLTLSRAGILSTVAALAIVVGLVLYRWLSGQSRLPLVLGCAAVAGAILVETWGAGVAYRVGSAGLFDFGRAAAYRSTLSIIAEHPLLGTGLGTYAEVFPAYRDTAVSTRGVWDRAHSTPLELAAEMGLPIAMAVAAVWIAAGGAILRGAFSRRGNAGVAIAALGVGVLGTLHSFVDFSLQIPGYSILFSVITGCGLAQSARDTIIQSDTGLGPAAG